MKLTVSKFYDYCRTLLDGSKQVSHPGEAFLAWIAKEEFNEDVVLRLELDMRSVYSITHATNYCKLFTGSGGFTDIVYNYLFFLYDVLFAAGKKAEAIDLLAHDFLGNVEDISSFKEFASELLLQHT